MSEQLRSKLVCGVGRERLERERRVPEEPATPRRSRREQLRACKGEEQERDVLHARRERLEQVEQRVVRPVNVLEEQQRRLTAGERLDEYARREEERLAVGDGALAVEADQHRELRGALGRLVRPDQIFERRAQLGVRVAELVAVEDARDLLHVLRESAVGSARAVGCRSPTEDAPAQ